MARKKKRKRRKIPLFKKFYKPNQQDEASVESEKTLQNVHCELAEMLADYFPITGIGDWCVGDNLFNLFIDPVFGNQLEIKGTSKMPVLKRLKIHIRLLKLIKGGYPLTKAVKMSLTV